MKADEALQKSARERANDVFANTLYSRLNRKTEGVIIVLMQRVHEEDLVGWLLRQGGWDHLNLPAIAVQDEDVPIGNGRFHHRKKGDLLNPEFESMSSLEETKRTIGTLHFQAQYEQAVRERCGYPTLSSLVLAQSRRHNPDALLLEDHGSGTALIQDLRQRHGIKAVPITPTGDKVVRLSIVSPMFERGEIFVPENAHWLMDFLDEILRFPQANFDDQIDSVTQYLNWHRNRAKTQFEWFWA